MFSDPTRHIQYIFYVFPLGGGYIFALKKGDTSIITILYNN
jgi:hypothetical protein